MVSDDLREWLAANGRDRAFKRNTYVFHQGDEATHIYLVRTGGIEIGSVASAGQRQLHAVLGPGELFGELGVVGELPRTATALAVEDSTLAVASGEEFLGYLASEPNVARAVMRALVAQLHEHELHLEDVLFLDLRGRVAKRLLSLAGGGSTTREMTQTDLASLCGGSRENVTRVLSEFQRRGYVERRGRRYVLKDTDRLRRLAGA
jgi:CRP/FNR family transcriptional regulator, cyclic AMP receptor protein